MFTHYGKGKPHKRKRGWVALCTALIVFDQHEERAPTTGSRALSRGWGGWSEGGELNRTATEREEAWWARGVTWGMLQSRRRRRAGRERREQTCVESGTLPAEAPRRALRKCAGDMSAAVNHPSEGDVRLLAVAELVEVWFARKLDHGRRAAPAGVSRTCP